MEENPIIIALNFTEEYDALKAVERLRPFTKRFKIGLPLFIRYGKPLIKKVLSQDTKIFLDLKLHDIPTVVAQALDNLNDLDIEFLTIHLQGGSELARLSKMHAREIKILGVTVLTSISRDEFSSIYNTELKNGVIKLAGAAAKAGLYGVVCSGYESKEIKELFPQLKTVVPGIRLSGESVQDQKRVLSPCDAIKNGADFIVVGRDITHHHDMEERIRLYLRELKQCG